jgi:hypothetical protein
MDFDHRLAAAVSKLRDALADSAENPRFAEQMPAVLTNSVGIPVADQIALPAVDANPRASDGSKTFFKV